jgi:hypothetical protein
MATYAEMVAAHPDVKSVVAVKIWKKRRLDNQVWTADGGAYYIAHDQATAVFQMLLATGTVTELTEVAAVGDVQATPGSWTWDSATGRLWARTVESADPGGGTYYIMSVVPERVATDECVIAGEPYQGLLQSANIPDIVTEISGLHMGGVIQSFGAVRINNDGRYDRELCNYIYEAAAIDIMAMGRRGDKKSDLLVMWAGWTGRTEWEDLQITIDITDLRSSIVDEFPDHVDVHADTPHSDVAHEDVHGDTPHEDSAHDDAHDDMPYGDTPHEDSAHDDAHDDMPYGDTPHEDTPHADVAHEDRAHLDVTHQDVTHVDVPHEDAEHYDTHTDTHDDMHDDFHGDIEDPHFDTHDDAHWDSHTDAYIDAVHLDSPHSDTPHSDVTHEDVHGDTAHEDVAHEDSAYSDTPHMDGHDDMPHGDLTHEDIAHEDIAHADTPHLDEAHVDSAHADTHTDTAHVDSAHVDTHTDTAHGDEAHSDTHKDYHSD